MEIEGDERDRAKDETVKPNEMSEAAVRTHAIKVRS